MNTKKCQVIFFGTPEFAVPTLKALINAPFCDVRLVVTQPDKPIGRHHSKLVPSAVKKVGQEAGLNVFNGSLLSCTQHQTKIVFDLGILVAYGEIIPKKIIDSFPLGILNIHPSLLPKYRGSSPIQNAILNQDRETGVTIMKLDDKMDHGPIIAQEKMSLRGVSCTQRATRQSRVNRNDRMTAGELHDTLAQVGANLLIKILPDYIAGKIKPMLQDESKASFTKKLTKQDGKIDWTKSAQEIDAHIRAMNPWPGAWTMWNNKRIIIWSMQKDSTPKVIQLQGKRRTSFEEFRRGYPEFQVKSFKLKEK